MMKLQLATVAVLLITLSACDRDDDIVRDNGVIVRQKPLWSTEISEDLNVANISILTPIIYDESKFLVGSMKDGQRSILSINAEDGQVNWEWSDLMGLITSPDYKDPIHIDRRAYYQYNNKLFFNYSTSSYCVDLETGKTIWKNKIARARPSNNAGIEDIYFSAGSDYEVLNDEKIYWGSVNSSAEEQLLLQPDYTQVENPPPLTLGFVNSMRPFKHGNDMYLAFGIENPYSDFGIEGMGLTELNLYNLTQSKYEYKKIVTNAWKDSKGINDMFYQSGNLYFQSANYLHGYEAMTGKELWHTFIGSAPLRSRMIFTDNKLIAACEDGILYCVDALTGTVLWREPNTRTCTEPGYLNGVIYYLGGGDGLLHAVDVATGKHLWKISSPDLKNHPDAWFFGISIVVPGTGGEKGVVIANTGFHVYAYEAIR